MAPSVTLYDAEEWWRNHCSPKAQHLYDEFDVTTPIELARCIGVTNQVIYNYMRNGRLEYTLNSSGKRVIEGPHLLSFLQHRLQKERDKQEKIERELRGGK